MPELVLVVDNVRSTHNVGSLFRTCDGLGVNKIYLCGITPHGHEGMSEQRLPHIITKLEKDIHKTALGAQDTVRWEYYLTTKEAIKSLKKDGFTVVALEQSSMSVPITEYKLTNKTALVVGPEVTGISQDDLALCDAVLEIPMHGTKESFNVSVAAGIALFTLLK